MTIDSFYTAQTGQAVQGTGSGAKASTGKGQPLQGLAFFDMFLANLEKALEQQGTLKTAEGSANPQEKAENVLLKALANSEYTLEELSKLDDPTLVDVLGLNQQVDDEILLQIKPPAAKDLSSIQESIAISGEADFRPALNNLQRVLQKISKMLEAQDPNLINTNLDAQQIADLQAKVEALLKDPNADIDSEEFAGVFVGLIRILPPQARPEVIVTGKSIIISNNPFNASGGQGAANDDLSRMNPLLQNSEGEFDIEDGVENLIKNMGKKDGNVFEAMLKNAGQAANTAAGGQGKTLPDLSLLQNWQSTGFPLLAGFDSSTALMDELGLSLNSMNALNSGTGLTAVVTQSSSANVPHPGTQMVAATLQRAGAAGDPSNITLQLDPPDLGRVEVKMSFEPGSKIKAVMTVEKPETMLMLQRDSQILERALQEVGLDSEGGLSFELADQDHPFSQDGSHDGSRNESGSHEDSDESEETLLDSTMTWMVMDPATGHIRYNILA